MAAWTRLGSGCLPTAPTWRGKEAGLGARTADLDCLRVVPKGGQIWGFCALKPEQACLGLPLHHAHVREGEELPGIVVEDSGLPGACDGADEGGPPEED